MKVLRFGIVRKGQNIKFRNLFQNRQKPAVLSLRFDSLLLFIVCVKLMVRIGKMGIFFFSYFCRLLTYTLIKSSFFFIFTQQKKCVAYATLNASKHSFETAKMLQLYICIFCFHLQARLFKLIYSSSQFSHCRQNTGYLSKALLLSADVIFILPPKTEGHLTSTWPPFSFHSLLFFIALN